MLQSLLEEASDVNGIVDEGKVGFSFIEVGFTSKGVQVWSKLFSGTWERLCEGESITKWYDEGSPIIGASMVTTSSASNVIVMVRRSMLESNGRKKHVMQQWCEIH